MISFLNNRIAHGVLALLVAATLVCIVMAIFLIPINGLINVWSDYISETERLGSVKKRHTKILSEYERVSTALENEQISFEVQAKANEPLPDLTTDDELATISSFDQTGRLKFRYPDNINQMKIGSSAIHSTTKLVITGPVSDAMSFLSLADEHGFQFGDLKVSSNFNAPDQSQMTIILNRYRHVSAPEDGQSISLSIQEGDQ